MGSDADGKPVFYLARAYGSNGWGLCKPYSYSSSDNSYVPSSSIAKYNGLNVYFDDGTKPTVKKTDTPYQPAKRAYYESVYCGVANPTGGVWGPSVDNAYYIPYQCESCGSVYGEYGSIGYAYDGPCETKAHYITGSYHPASPEVAGTRTYNISWKNTLATITLSETQKNTSQYNEYTCRGSLFSSDGTEDSIIKINPDSTVEIEWYGAGVDSGHCDVVWRF